MPARVSSEPRPAKGSSSSIKRGRKRERHRDLERALLAMREFAGRVARASEKSDAFERRPRGRVQPFLAARRCRRSGSSNRSAPAPPAPHFRARCIRAARRRSGTIAQVQARRAPACRARICRGPRRQMRPASGCSGAGELVDQRRLAGPIGADQRDEAAFVHAEADVVGDGERAEAFRQAFDAQQGRAHAAPPASLGVSAPASPRRPKSATTTRSGPMRTCVWSVTERKRLFEREIDDRAEHGAPQRPDAAEDRHHEEFARALPGHEGRRDEFALVGEQRPGDRGDRPGDHAGGELETGRAESQAPERARDFAGSR